MKITLRTTLDKDLAQRAKKIARIREISLSAILERALDRYLALLANDDLDERENKERRRA